jgi:hypothetical protein
VSDSTTQPRFTAERSESERRRLRKVREARRRKEEGRRWHAGMKRRAQAMAAV